MQDQQDLRNDFHRAGKSKYSASKIMRVWTKNEENFEILRKHIPLEDNTRFLQQFFRFRGEGHSGVLPPPPPDATDY